MIFTRFYRARPNQTDAWRMDVFPGNGQKAVGHQAIV